MYYADQIRWICRARAEQNARSTSRRASSEGCDYLASRRAGPPYDRAVIVVVAVGMLLAGLAVGGVGTLLLREGGELAGVAGWSRRLIGCVLLLFGLVIAMGTVGAVINPF